MSISVRGILFLVFIAAILSAIWIRWPVPIVETPGPGIISNANERITFAFDVCLDTANNSRPAADQPTSGIRTIRRICLTKANNQCCPKIQVSNITLLVNQTLN